MDQSPYEDYYTGMDYCIKVSCSDIVTAESLITSPSSADDTVKVRIVVRIKHHSSSDPKTPKSIGYITSQNVSIQRSDDLCWPEIIRSLLHFMHIPFSLENERIILRKAEYNIDDLIEELAKIICHSRKGHVRVCLKITKLVDMEKNELEVWNSFRRYKESEYLDIVHKGPTCELRMWSAVAMELEKLRMTNAGGCKQESCQICLQELQDYSPTMEQDQGRRRRTRNEELTRLPCSHMFHEACIQKWFQINQTCPCCRATALCIPDRYLDFVEDVTLYFH